MELEELHENLKYFRNSRLKPDLKYLRNSSLESLLETL